MAKAKKVEKTIELIREFLERDDVRIKVSYQGTQVQSIVFSRGSAKVEQKEIEKQVFDLLKDLSIPQHVRGWKYLTEGLIMVWNNPELLESITGTLYPQIVEKFIKTNLEESEQPSVSRVERTIRHAIEVAWERGDIKKQEEIFGNFISKSKGKPTNLEFFSVCYYYLQKMNS